VPYLFGMFLHRYLKAPVGIINVARGGTTGDAWCLREELDGLEHVTVTETLRKYDAETATWNDPAEVERIMAGWENEVAEAKAAHDEALAEARAEGRKEPRLRLPKRPADPRSGWSPPAGLFNATVMPIRHLAVRGVLYYQGENNVFNRWTRYEHTFPRVPVSFRRAFGDPELPFGCISQPGWGTFGRDPEVETVKGGYAIIRDIQRRALKDDPHSAMIATYPTGNSYIHPAEKFPVAEYASLWALARVYGEPVVHRGNEFQRMVIRDGRACLYFDSDPVVHERWKHIEDNASWQVLPQPYQGKAPIEGFIIAGRDRRWYPAKAREKRLDGNWAIEVWSDLVDEPVAVRYGWANWPTGNLVGRERLPVPTFRTDDWPIVEGMSYSEEVRKATEEKIRAMEEEAARLALDRKIRQMLLDLPVLEKELRKGDATGQLLSKLDRITGILDELLADPWLAGQLGRSRPELLEDVKALGAEAGALRAGITAQ
jgi:sialate O-acetylesterase